LDIDFSVEPGQTIGIIGATGSGKTTLINMIPRFYDVDEGAVLLDGKDVRDYDLAELRRNIGLVLQTSLLFSSTIRENISFGNPDASEEDIIKAAEAALAHEFITKLPEGYDTVVGERGITLSGGQRQRVAIARALLVNPSILIMDDSTSSVDTETEHKIQQALDKLIENRTTMIIAQRLSSVRDADLILVMDEGQIKERGIHADLLKMNGLYKEIYDLQLTQQENFDEDIRSINSSREEKNG
jgi:ATP-binding cassette subfamily B protein